MSAPEDYEVLDSLVEKGFAQEYREKTNCFPQSSESAVPSYLPGGARAASGAHRTGRMAGGLVDDFGGRFLGGAGGRGTLDYLRIVSDPGKSPCSIVRCWRMCRRIR